MQLARRVAPTQLIDPSDAGRTLALARAAQCSEILAGNEDLSALAPVVADSGEGRWTALESIELGVPAPVITAALMERFSSQGKADHARRLLALMRAGFGGHAVKKPE